MFTNFIRTCLHSNRIVSDGTTTAQITSKYTFYRMDIDTIAMSANNNMGNVLFIVNVQRSKHWMHAYVVFHANQLQNRRKTKMKPWEKC